MPQALYWAFGSTRTRLFSDKPKKGNFMWFVGILSAWLMCFGVASATLVANADQGDVKEFFQSAKNTHKGP